MCTRLALCLLTVAALQAGCQSPPSGSEPSDGTSQTEKQIARPDEGDETEDPTMHKHEHEHDQPGRNVDDYIRRLEQDDRAEWQQPDKVVAALHLHPGENVADVGAGSGYFTIPIAQRIAPRGKVYAVDIEPGMIEHIEKRAREEGLTNVMARVVPPDDPELPVGTIDTVIIVNTYHHLTDRMAYLEKLKQALAPGGRVVNIDFVPKPREERGFGPPLEHQLAQIIVDAEFRAAGFDVAKEHDFLPEQYFVEYQMRRRP